MKAEIVHEVALRAARFCRQIERRSFETQETPDSAQGVEVIYVEIVQQYLATELRLPQNIKQKRKPVKIQVVVTGITGKGYGVPGAVHGVRDVVADRRRTEIVQRCVETQSHLPQHPEEKRTLEMRSAAASGAASLAQADAETAELERRRMVSSADILEDVTRDISYLLKQINDLSRMESEATSEIPLTSDEVGAAAECGTVQKRL